MTRFKLVEKMDELIGKRNKTRQTLVNNAFGDMRDVERMSDEEFKFMQAVLEQERLTDELLARAAMAIEELQHEVDELSKSLQREMAK